MNQPPTFISWRCLKHRDLRCLNSHRCPDTATRPVIPTLVCTTKTRKAWKNETRRSTKPRFPQIIILRQAISQIHINTGGVLADPEKAAAQFSSNPTAFSGRCHIINMLKSRNSGSIEHTNQLAKKDFRRREGASCLIIFRVNHPLG